MEIKASARVFVWSSKFLALLTGFVAVMTLRGFHDNATVFIYFAAGTYTMTWLVIAFSVLPAHYAYMMEKRRQGRR